MPCYVNPDVAKSERDLCEKRWLFFQVMKYAELSTLPQHLLEKYTAERAEYVAHRREDREFLMDYLDRQMAVRPNDALALESIKQEVRALTDDQLVETYWGTWEEQQLSTGEYRGQVLSAAAHPPSHIGREPFIPRI